MLMSYVWAVALPMIAVVLMRLSRRKPGETLSPLSVIVVVFGAILLVKSHEIMATEIGLPSVISLGVVFVIVVATTIAIGIIDAIFEELNRNRYGPLP